MKRTLAKTLRSGLALVLAFCMTFGLCGTALATKVAATETDTKTIKYVSLGDSMTNGYGLSGYKYNGYLQYVEDSYPAQFAKHLKNSGATVEHTPLAMSAMRAEDLHFILEFDYNDSNAVAVATMEEWNEADWNAKFSVGDYYTWDEFTTSNRFNNGAYNGEGFSPISTVKNYGAGVKNVAKTYQEAVANADIISIGSGNANFGVFLLGRIMNAIGFDNGSAESDSWIKLENALRECDAETKEQAMKAYNDLKTRLSGAGLPADLVDPMVNAITYTIVSYMLNYAGAVERIVELNPDAEIMIVGLMNTMNGMEFTLEGQKYDLGQYMYGALSVVNAYLAGMVTAHQAAGKYPDATFYYAEASNVDVWVNNFASEIEVNNDIRERFVIEIVGGENASDGEWEPGMVWPMMGTMVESMTETMFGQKLSLQNITLADVQDYEAALNKLAAGDTTAMASYTSNMGKALSCALYLAFEDAIVESSKVKNDATLSFDGLLALGKLDASLFSKVAEDFNNNIASAITEQKKPMVLAAATAQGTTIPEHGENVDVWNCEDENHQVCIGLQQALSATDNTIDPLCILLAMPGTMSKALQSDEMIFGLLNMFARCLIGDGLGAHPSKAGHVDLTNAVIASYDGKHTAADQTKDNLIEAAGIVADLAAEYYDEAYAYAYTYAADNGYIDTAVAAIDTAIEAVKGLDFSGIEMTAEFASKIPAQAKAVTDTLKAAKALIVEADVLDQAALDSLLTLLDEAEDNLDTLLDLLTQAGVDVNKLVIKPALDKAYEEISKAVTTAKEKLSAAVKAGTDKLMEKLGDAYDAFVEAVKDAAENVKDTAEQLPDWIYDYLYNNPEKVIAFFNEYGDDAIAFLNEYKEEALMVLGYVALNFGEDMLDLVLDNADEILKKSVELLNEHGENAWALIKVYLDELGIDLEEVAKDTLTAAAEAVKDLVAQYAKEAYEYAYNYAKDKGIVTAITDALDALNEKLDAAAKWVEENAKALGDELYTELMDEINAAKALIADIKATIKNAVELGTDTVAKIQQMLTDLGATLETIADMLRNCDCNLGEEAWSYFQNTVKPAIIEKLNDAVKAGASWLVDKLGDAYDAFVDAVVEAAKEYAPEVADWIYDYLYNNAEDVIAFFNKYGDDAIAFLNEFKEEVMAVLGYVAVNFGEDALEFVMDNAEEILKKTVEWLEKHGENAWKLIKVYLEELGLLENLPTEDDVQNILDKVTDVLDKFGPAVEDELLGLTDKVITELKTAVEELIDLIETELKNATGEAKEKLEELYDAAQELKAAIEKLVEEGVDAAIAEVQAALNAVADAVEDAIAVVSEEAAAKLNEITEGIKAALNEAYIEATTVKYVRHEDSYYVALGDGTAASESYVDALAEELDIEYKNLAEEGMLVEDAYALLKTNAADIKKADLITIGFGNNTFVNEVVAQVLNGETPDFAWETYVGEEGLPYVEDALADVHEYFVESGVDGTAMGVEDMPALLTSAVEAYAFNCVSYACNLPELINAIRQINGEAAIVIVGMYNSLQDVTVTLGGTEFELTEYVDYLVDAAGVHALTYSMVTGNSVYVAAPDVETNLTDKELNVLDLMREFMLYQGKNLNPSEDGHEYIKDQIMNAMDTKFDIAFANMTLANSLAMNFAFEQGHMSDWTGSYAQIVKTYADGRDDVVATIPASEWGQAGISGVAYYTISFNGIAAKEMTDEIYVTIYNAEGEAVSNVWEDTVRDYASRVLSNASSNKETQVMVVDMLNYGAGAQSFFKYNTEDLANGELTEAQKALATKSIETANSLVKGEKYLGTSLTLESKILLNMAFQGATSDMKAEVSFTDHYGNKKVSEAELKVSGNVAVVDIDQIAVADAREMVTVTIYNADGSVYGTATDSVESYIARISELDPLFELIMKFADSAHAFFH